MTRDQAHAVAVRMDMVLLGLSVRQVDALAEAVAEGMDGSALSMSAAAVISAWTEEAKAGRGVQFALRVLAMAQGKPEATLAEVIQLDKYRNAATAQTPGAA